MTERQDVRPLTTEDLVSGNRTTESAENYDAQPYDRVADDRLDTPYTDTDTTNTTDTVDGAETYDQPDQVDQHDQVEESLPRNEERAPVEDTAEGARLFAEDEVNRYRDEWRALQADFVDTPREAVQHADELVAQVIQSLATTFADHKRSLEGQWQEGEQVDTEELRIALRRYRSFFDQLLTV